MSESGFTNKDGEPLAVQFNVTRSFTEGNGVTVVTTVPQTAEQADIDNVADKIMRAIDRMEIHARVSALNNDLESHAKQKAQLEFSLDNLARKHGDYSKANADTKSARDQTTEALSRVDLLMAALISEQDRLRKGL